MKKLKNAVKLQTKNEQVVKAAIGIDGMKEEDIAENVMAVYNVVFHEVHDDKHKIKSVILKFSMGRPFVVGEKYTEEELRQPFKKELKKKTEKEKKSKKDEDKKEVKEEMAKKTEKTAKRKKGESK